MPLACRRRICSNWAKKKGVPVGALVGSKQHAVKQAEAGVDILIVSGTEAGGHCGEVSTMVLVPEVAEAVAEFDGVSILAAGGIVTGRQIAAAMAMGAHGAWCGSVWLTTQAGTARSSRNCSLPARTKPFGRKAALASIHAKYGRPGPTHGNQATPRRPITHAAAIARKRACAFQGSKAR